MTAEGMVKVKVPFLVCVILLNVMMLDSFGQISEPDEKSFGGGYG